MTDYTPSKYNLRIAWRAWRKELLAEQADDEFKRFFTAHDQRIRDGVKVPPRTPADLASAAFVVAYEVKRGQVIPAGTPVIMRQSRGKVTTYFHGCDHKLIASADVRTLTPLPPLIPDDCLAVWASTEDCDVRRIMMRSTVSPWGWLDSDGDTYDDDALIDPVPVPPESEARA